MWRFFVVFSSCQANVGVVKLRQDRSFQIINRPQLSCTVHYLSTPLRLQLKQWPYGT
jgi:hypothetical protein